MPDFSFRVRLIKSPRTTLNIDSNSWALPLSDKRASVVLSARMPDITIQKSPELVLRGDGWQSEQEASNEAERYKQALMLSLARVRVGGDFGARAPKGGFTKYGLKMLEHEKGQRVLNDMHGIMVFETEPPPLFASIEASGIVGIPKERFEAVLLYAVEHPWVLNERKLLSLELFHASFFQKMADARFLLLMMAIEALLVPSERSSAAVLHVETLISKTRKSSTISSEEKTSILGSLKWLRCESINQTGRKLVNERLGSRTYLNKSASDFFSYCYDLRSGLVHGRLPYPSWQEVSGVVAALEVFVSDVLSGPLIDVGN